MFKRRMKIASLDLTAYYDKEAEAIWVSFLVPDYIQGESSEKFEESFSKAKEKLIRVLASLGVRAKEEDLELDIPEKLGDKMCSVIFFFKNGEMPEKEKLNQVSKEIDIPSQEPKEGEEREKE